MNRPHTNVATLWMAASNILQCTGRIEEHELWVNDPYRRTFIDRELRNSAREIADWLGCDLVERHVATVTIVPCNAEEEAA